RVDLGGGDNQFTLAAAIRPELMPSSRQWHIDLTTGAGHNMVHTDIAGSVPVLMTANLGGHDISIFEFHDVEGGMPAPTEVTVNSTGISDIKVIYGFNGQPEPPGDVGHIQAPILTTVNGGMHDDISVIYGFNGQPEPPGTPPLAFNIPLVTNINGGGD